MQVIFLGQRTIHRLWGLLGLALGILILMIGLTHYREAFTRIGELTVVIDPGHGGVDSGTQDHLGNLEKDYNLKFGLELDEVLRQSGLRTILTRDRDIPLEPFTGRPGRHRRDLLARLQKAKESRSLFLVSLHCDWSKDRSEAGATVFYNHHFQSSQELALIVQEELNRVQSRPRKAAPGKYLIIREPGISGVLVEVGFLSNPEEAGRLLNAEYRRRLVQAMVTGILKYSRRYISTIQ